MGSALQGIADMVIEVLLYSSLLRTNQVAMGKPLQVSILCHFRHEPVSRNFPAGVMALGWHKDFQGRELLPDNNITSTRLTLRGSYVEPLIEDILRIVLRLNLL